MEIEKISRWRIIKYWYNYVLKSEYYINPKQLYYVNTIGKVREKCFSWKFVILWLIYNLKHPKPTYYYPIHYLCHGNIILKRFSPLPVDELVKVQPMTAESELKFETFNSITEEPYSHSNYCIHGIKIKK